MDRAEAIQRAWFTFGIGAVFLVLVFLQIWAGKTPRPYAVRAEWVKRGKEPGTFWFNVGCQLLLAIFCIGLALARFIQF
jgi:hypothetical protein